MGRRRALPMLLIGPTMRGVPVFVDMSLWTHILQHTVFSPVAYVVFNYIWVQGFKKK